MTTEEIILLKVTDCFNDYSLGFTDVFNDVRVSIYTYFHRNITVVSISGKPAKDFDRSDVTGISKYICESIKK